MNAQTFDPVSTRWWAGLASVPAVAGILYTLSWVFGLTVSSSSTDVQSTGAEVIRADAGHQGAVIAQFVLTEGVASIALAVVALALCRAGIRAGQRALGSVVATTGVAAAAIALVQCVLGVVLAESIVPSGHAATAATINETINRLDGAKMFILAALAIAGTALAGRTDLLPPWLRWTGAALAVAITASGFGYALLNSTLAVAAWVSLPLLLTFVTGAGVVLGHGAQRR